MLASLFDTTLGLLTLVYQRLAREIRLWSTLNHRYILPFFGFHLSAGLDEAWLITPYEPSGNVNNYVRSTFVDDLERIRLVSEPLAEGPRRLTDRPNSGELQAQQILIGILYLHSQPIPICHGDLRGVRVPLMCGLL